MVTERIRDSAVGAKGPRESSNEELDIVEESLKTLKHKDVQVTNLSMRVRLEGSAAMLDTPTMVLHAASFFNRLVNSQVLGAFIIHSDSVGVIFDCCI